MPFLIKIFIAENMKYNPPKKHIRIKRKSKKAPYATFSLAEGSLTTEAAMVIPLFIMCLTALLCIILAIQIQVRVQKALYNQAMKTAGYSYYLSLADASETVEEILQEEYIKYAVIDEVGRDFLDRSIVVGGSRGISLGWTPMPEERMFDVLIKYKIKVPFDFLGIAAINMTARARCHTWEPGESGNASWDEEYVYMTPHGSVYHTYRDCTYLEVKVQQTKMSSAMYSYSPCSICTKTAPNLTATVYITEYGTKYHVDRMCRSLIKNYMCISKEEAEKNYPICSKCNERED